MLKPQPLAWAFLSYGKRSASYSMCLPRTPRAVPLHGDLLMRQTRRKPENRDLPSTLLQDREEILPCRGRLELIPSTPACSEGGCPWTALQAPLSRCCGLLTQSSCAGEQRGARCHGQSAEGMLVPELPHRPSLEQEHVDSSRGYWPTHWHLPKQALSFFGLGFFGVVGFSVLFCFAFKTHLSLTVAAK